MTEVRCPKCNRLIGFFDGRGEIVCPRCRKKTIVHFDTMEKRIEIRAS